MASPNPIGTAPETHLSPDQVDIETAYLAIPDEGYEPLMDLRKTYRITVASSVIFVAVVFVFIL